MSLNFKNLIKSKDFREYFIIILIAVVIYVGFRITIKPYYIDGPSMEPGYWENERVLVDKLAYKFHIPTRGDIIIFQPPITSKAPYIKRVIGLSGESVEINNGTVYVHGTDGSIIIMQEPYIKEVFSCNYNAGVIPADKYFVMGDNRNNSSDSRGGWLASRDNIIGKAWISYWLPGLWRLAPAFWQPASATAIPRQLERSSIFVLYQVVVHCNSVKKSIMRLA
jgi:signal peptidase I